MHCDLAGSNLILNLGFSNKHDQRHESRELCKFVEIQHANLGRGIEKDGAYSRQFGGRPDRLRKSSFCSCCHHSATPLSLTCFARVSVSFQERFPAVAASKSTVE